MAERIAERGDERASSGSLVGHPDDDDRFDHPSEDEADMAWDEHEGMLEWGVARRTD